MDKYQLAWLLVAGGGVLGLLFLTLALRRAARPGFLVLLLPVLAALLFVPAPVPGFDGHWAPAFVVAIFEGFFQSQGAPQQSLRLLGAGLLIGLIIGLSLVGLLWARRRHVRRASEASVKKSSP